MSTKVHSVTAAIVSRSSMSPSASSAASIDFQSTVRPVKARNSFAFGTYTLKRLPQLQV
jgi:hypothetical protein